MTSTAALSQHLQQQVLSQPDRGAIELETLTSQGHTGTGTGTGVSTVGGKKPTDDDGQRRNLPLDTPTFTSVYLIFSI